jgi:hypothetical protein
MKLFPSVSLSQLRAQRARDKAKFHQSTDELQQIVHMKTRPVQFFLDRPGMLVGGLTSLFALYQVGTSVLNPTPLKLMGGPARKTLGILGRLSRLGMGFAMKAATPAISSVVQKVWKYAAASRRKLSDLD